MKLLLKDHAFVTNTYFMSEIFMLRSRVREKTPRIGPVFKIAFRICVDYITRVYSTFFYIASFTLLISKREPHAKTKQSLLLWTVCISAYFNSEL